MPLTPYAHLAHSAEPDGSGGMRYRLSDDWLQGRTAFGGVMAALAVDAMRRRGADEWPPSAHLRALQTNFVGPVSAGAMEVAVTPLRTGKNVRQVQAVISQHGSVAALLLGVWGSGRASALPQRRPTRPQARHAPGDLPALPYIAGMTPHFTQHLDMRWDDGPLPFSGGGGFRTSIHLRLKDPVAVPVEQAVVLLADASPTPVLGHFRQPTPASSVSWALETLPLDQADLSGWWRADNEATVVSGGYVNQTTRLWAPSGELASLGHQVVTVYG